VNKRQGENEGCSAVARVNGDQAVLSMFVVQSELEMSGKASNKVRIEVPGHVESQSLLADVLG